MLFWTGLALVHLPLCAMAVLLAYIHRKVLQVYVPRTLRIFQEKPLFIVPRGQPTEGAEAVRFRTADGLTLNGCYLKARAPRRRGVILFGLEFGSNCWSCAAYCDHLLAAGFDVFAFESRGQGDSENAPGYEPLQWVTDFEVTDTRAALAYLRSRDDADPRGVGLFGISKGAGAGVVAAASDPAVRCVVTDGMFSTYLTLLPYMQHWLRIYTTFPAALIPDFYFRHIARITLGMAQRDRRCSFAPVEEAVKRLAGRPLLMIHGEQDTYIKPEMARGLFERAAAEPRELWVVPAAKHNQGLHVAGDEYRTRVLRFFETHLASA